MANDYIFIRCKGCGRWTRLAKYYPGLIDFCETKGTPGGGTYTFEEWMYSHSEEDHFLQGDLGDDPGFELLTESSYNELDKTKEGMGGMEPGSC